VLSISLKVEGMTDRAGEGGLPSPERIRTALSGIAGVLDAGYEKGRDRFFLTLDPRLVSVLTIITTIERLGRDSGQTYRPSDVRPESLREPRALIAFEVHYQTREAFLSAYSFNLSGGGLFLCTSEPLPVGDRIRVRFTLPGSDAPFEATAQVAWLSEARLGNPYPAGMGVQFLDLPLEARDAIAALITAHLPQPPKASGTAAS
jgi:uncharacterized protein (TIGR02266 family)